VFIYTFMLVYIYVMLCHFISMLENLWLCKWSNVPPNPAPVGFQDVNPAKSGSSQI